MDKLEEGKMQNIKYYFIICFSEWHYLQMKLERWNDFIGFFLLWHCNTATQIVCFHASLSLLNDGNNNKRFRRDLSWAWAHLLFAVHSISHLSSFDSTPITFIETLRFFLRHSFTLSIEHRTLSIVNFLLLFLAIVTAKASQTTNRQHAWLFDYYYS